MSLGQAQAACGEDPGESYVKAIEEYGEALRRNPESTAAYSNRGNAYVNLGQAQAARGEKPGESYGKAIEDYGEAVKRDPALWRDHMNMGLLFEMRARYEEAVACYEKALSIVKDGVPQLKPMLANARAAAAVPSWARALSRAGKRIGRGDYAGAGELYEKGLASARKAGADNEARFRPLLVSAHYNLACILSQASIGKKGKRAEPKPVPPEEATELRGKAVIHLRKALELGWTDLEHIRKDPDLDPIRDLPEFKALMKEWEKKLGKEKGEKKD